ncbi:hypothetical protein HYQ46_006242 [Verticillium longisporum]|nr:hypothetical protein HYQ46_006242 [Verticillium longisporum]
MFTKSYKKLRSSGAPSTRTLLRVAATAALFAIESPFHNMPTVPRPSPSAPPRISPIPAPPVSLSPSHVTAMTAASPLVTPPLRLSKHLHHK